MRLKIVIAILKWALFWYLKLDKNRDGKISKKELKQFYEKL